MTNKIIMIFFVLAFGKADFILQKIEECPDKEVVGGIQLFVTQRKFNRTSHVVELTLVTEVLMDNSLTLEFCAAIKKEGGYKQGALYWKKPLCDALYYALDGVFDDYLKAIEMSECRIPTGTYHVKDFYFDNEKYNTAQLYGEYKMEFHIFNGNDLVACFLGYYELVPKGQDE